MLPLAVLLVAQARAWAIDTTTATTIDQSPGTLSQPWIWIVLTALIIIKLIGPFSEITQDFTVIRKKVPAK